MLKKLKKIAKKLLAFFKLCKNFSKEIKNYNIVGYHTLPLFFDFVFCYFKYKCCLEEFCLLKLYIYKNSYRKHFLMRKFNHTTVFKISKRGVCHSKFKNYEIYKQFFNRDCILVDGTDEEGFFDFVKQHGKVIMKPDCGSCGRGIFTLTNESAAHIKAAFLSSMRKKYICEEYIIQHPCLDEIYPNSVNTCRFLSFFDGKDVKILSAVLRIGKGENSVDNICAGGIGVDIDINTGILVSKGVDYNNNSYVCHPDTHKVLPGIQLPFWTEAVELNKKVHLACSECSLLGIDIAFAENGPCFIELNNAPGPMINQLVNQKPCGREIHEFVKTHRLYDKHNKRIG